MSIDFIPASMGGAVSNASVSIEAVYSSPAQGLYGAPEWVELRVRTVASPHWEKTVHLPFSKLNMHHLMKECSFLQIYEHQDWDRSLMDALQRGLFNGAIKRGYYLEQSGATYFADGSIAFLRGQELIGIPEGTPYLLGPQISDNALAGNSTTNPRDLIDMMLRAPLQVLLILAYVILTSVRSLVLDHGINYQAVLYIVGGQGLGKTTLASRIAAIYRRVSDNKTAGFIQAGSSGSATGELLVDFRDQPVIVDDLCLSASREVARKRRDLGATLIRLGAGEIPIEKKQGHKNKVHRCTAGLILTAEFSLENMSDLTRCLFIPLDKPLRLSPDWTPERIGDAVRAYSHWFCENIVVQLRNLDIMLDSPLYSDMEQRMRTNYICLKWAFTSLLTYLNSLGSNYAASSTLENKMEKSLTLALTAHEQHRQALLSRVPKGNLAWVILEGYRKGGFHLAKKLDKLYKRDGIEWNRDLCLRPEALIRFVRLQPGYQDWSRNKITRKLKDWGALVLQEEKCDSVHLKKAEKGISYPRVYRIRLDVLKDHEKIY